MTLRTLASLIAKREGKKSQARIGDVREILSKLTDILAEELLDGGLSTADALDAETNRKLRKLRNGRKIK